MSIALQRDDQRHWLLARISGPLTIEEVVHFLRTARSPIEVRSWPLLVDAITATSQMKPDDIDRAVAVVAHIQATESVPRGHVAIAADDDELYAQLLLYEARCADLGVRIIRVFRRLTDAEHWLEILSAARYF